MLDHTLLILQAILGKCNFREDFGNHELLDKVLKSVGHTSRGMMGPYCVGHALRIAVEFADPPTRTRFIDLLASISASYAAVTPTKSPGVLPVLVVGRPDSSASLRFKEIRLDKE